MKKRTAMILAILLAAAMTFAAAESPAAETPDTAMKALTFAQAAELVAEDGAVFTEQEEQTGTIVAYDPETLPDPSAPSSYKEAWFEARQIGTFTAEDGTKVHIALSEEYGLFAYTWGSPCRVDHWYIREAGYTFLPEEPAAE